MSGCLLLIGCPKELNPQALQQPSPDFFSSLSTPSLHCRVLVDSQEPQAFLESKVTE